MKKHFHFLKKMIILKKIKNNKMLSYVGIQIFFNYCVNFFENIKNKILNYKMNIIQTKNNYIKKIKLSKNNKFLEIKNNLYDYKEKIYDYKEKIIIKYNNFYRYWLNNYEKIK